MMDTRTPRLAIATALTTLVAGCSLFAPAGAAPSSRTPGQPQDVIGVTVYPAGHHPSIPNVAGRTLTSGTLALASLRGHVVVLNAWASWCVPCRSESKTLAAVARGMATAGVRFVGLDEGDEASAARSFAASAGVTYPQLVDADGTLLAQLGLVPAAAIPSTLILDPAGRVAARVIGPVDAATFPALVRSVLQQRS